MQHPYRPGQPLKWGRLRGMHRLQLAADRDEPSSFDMPDSHLRESVRNRAKVIPCLTDGRPPPPAQAHERTAVAHWQSSVRALGVRGPWPGV